MEVGISDLHDLIFSFLKTTFKKMPPNNLQYRNQNCFEADSFLKVVENLSATICYAGGGNGFLKTLNSTSLSKQKWFEEIINLLLQKFEKGNYEMISFENEGKYLR